MNLDTDAIADALKLPQAEMAQANAHQLLSGMSPWGTIDDLELINLAHDEDEEITPIWHGVPGHEEFSSTAEAVNAFANLFVSILKADWKPKEDEDGCP